MSLWQWLVFFAMMVSLFGLAHYADSAAKSARLSAERSRKSAGYATRLEKQVAHIAQQRDQLIRLLVERFGLGPALEEEMMRKKLRTDYPPTESPVTVSMNNVTGKHRSEETSTEIIPRVVD